jgi:hypothetical protein
MQCKIVNNDSGKSDVGKYLLTVNRYMKELKNLYRMIEDILGAYTTKRSKTR